MKSLKKIMAVLVLAFVAMAAFGCTIDFGGNSVEINEGNNNVNLQEIFNSIRTGLGDCTNVTADLTLPTSKDGVSIVWSSSNPAVITTTGEVTRPLDDTEVQLSCVLKLGEETKKFNLIVIVKGNRAEVGGYDKISDVIASEDGSCTINGVVVAFTSQSFLVKDETGYILVYKGRDFAKDVEVGSKVIVSGNTTVYGGMKQFGTDATYTLAEKETVTAPTAETIDGAGLDALSQTSTVKYIKVSGILKMSGSYVNLDVNGASVKGSLSYPATDLSAFDGKGVDVEGYYIGVSGSTTKYVNIINMKVTENPDVTVVTPPVEGATEGTIAEIIAAEVGKNYKTEAVVIAVAKQGLLVKDASGMMYVYAGEDVAADIAVGSKVELVGATSSYGGFVQFNKPTITLKGTEEVTQPEATTLTKESYEALLEATSLGYYKFTAKLTISNNKYFNLTFEGSTATGSLVAPREDLTALNDKNVDVEGYFVYVTGSTTKYIYFIATSVAESEDQGGGGTVTPPVEEATEGTIAEILAAEVGKKYKTDAVVIAVAKQGLLVKDASGMMYVYSGEDVAADIAVGSKVEVVGDTSTYGGFVQFNKPTVTLKGTEEFTQPQATVLTKEAYEALLEATSLGYYKLTAKLTISNNKYFNLTVEGSEVAGSLVAPRQDVAALDGKNVDVTGYFVYVSGSSKKYVYFIATNVVESGNQGGGTGTSDVTEGTVAEILAAEVGKDYKTEAVVIAIAKQGMLVKDSTGMMYVYAGADIEATVTVGSKVQLVGPTSLYGGFVQFNKPTITVKGTEEVTYPEATVLTKDTYEALLEATSLGYYKLTATLSISNNKYFNLVFEGSEVAGSLVAPREDLSELNNKAIDVEGYFVYISGSSTKYIYFIATSIKGSDGTTPITVNPIEGTIAEILAAEVGKVYKTTGTVVAANAQSFLIQDDSGLILCYMGTTYEKDLVVGDVVTVTGESTTYQGSVQFNRANYEKTGETKQVTYPNPKVLSAEEFDALDTTTPTTQYVEVLGYVTISDRYVNFEVAGAYTYGSIAYPVEDLSAYNEQLVKITGYYTYVAGSDIHYIYIIATKLEMATDAEVVKYIKDSNDSTEGFEVIAPLMLPTEVMGATLVWTSSNPNVLSNDGQYNPPAEDTNVTYTITITKGEATATASFVVIAKAPETIASIRALNTEELDTTVYHQASGTVVAAYKEGFLIKDATGYILVYRGAGTAIPEVGTKVSVYGTLSLYGGLIQFNKGTMYGILGQEEVTHPEATALDGAGLDALLESTEIKYYKFRAKLNISGNRYFNLVVNGATTQGSLAAPIADLTELNGKDVDVTGYFVYVTGSTTKYIYFVGVNVEEAELTDAEYVALAETELLKMNGKSFKKDLTLPLESNKCTVSWASNNTAVIGNDGKYTMPSSDTEVTLTATITKGNESKTVEIKVTALYVDPNAVEPVKLDLGSHEDFATWTNSYTAHELVFDDHKVEFTRACKQTGTVTDAPILGANASNPTVYAIVTGNFDNMKYARVITKEWNSGATAKYEDIHLEYTTDGSTWITCSDVLVAPGTMLSTEMSNIKAFRLSYTIKEGSSGNAQLPLVSIEFAPNAFAND